MPDVGRADLVQYIVKLLPRMLQVFGTLFTIDLRECRGFLQLFFEFVDGLENVVNLIDCLFTHG
jgi:hypothetical protein